MIFHTAPQFKADRLTGWHHPAAGVPQNTSPAAAWEELHHAHMLHNNKALASSHSLNSHKVFKFPRRQLISQASPYPPLYCCCAVLRRVGAGSRDWETACHKKCLALISLDSQIVEKLSITQIKATNFSLSANSQNSIVRSTILEWVCLEEIQNKTAAYTRVCTQGEGQIADVQLQSTFPIAGPKWALCIAFTHTNQVSGIAGSTNTAW